MLRAVVMMIFLGWASGAHAFDLKAAETLRYDVLWGPMKVGHVQLDYSAKAGKKKSSLTTYTVKAHVWDDSRFIDMDDTWQSTGTHARKKTFVPERYEALQKENKYRADKLVAFDAKKRTVTYTNRRDMGDKVAPLRWEGKVRDALSAVYAWRLLGMEELQQNERIEVMGVKRPFTLIRSPAVYGREAVGSRAMNVWSVELTSEVDGKPSKDSWTVRLRDDGKLTPVQVIAHNKFGTFTANLKE